MYINGLDVEEDASEVQQIIGVCAQDDLLWDDLTAREHMLLTAAFKGIAFGDRLLNAVDNVLELVQLRERAEDFCRQFSGGMKRRLSVAMSTVGDVDVLFFDGNVLLHLNTSCNMPFRAYNGFGSCKSSTCVECNQYYEARSGCCADNA